MATRPQRSRLPKEPRCTVHDHLEATLAALTNATRDWATLPRLRMLIARLQGVFQDIFGIDKGFIIYARQGYMPATSPGSAQVEFAWGPGSVEGRARINAWLRQMSGLPLVSAELRERWQYAGSSPHAIETLLQAFEAQSAGFWPLVYRGRHVGAFLLFRSEVHGDDDSALISFFLGQVALLYDIFLQRRLAEETSRRDLLTGLWNRQGVREHVQGMLASAERHGETLMLTVVDVNNLKTVNDRSGHLAGDAVLRAVARSLQGHVRQGDIVGRWGGDEFVLLMLTASADAGAIADRLAELVRGGDPPYSVSVGCARWGIDGSDFRDCFAIADRRCYEQKQQFRATLEGTGISGWQSLASGPERPPVE